MELFTGHISSGAMNDLERATKSAYGMVAYLAPPHPQTIRSGDFFVVDGTGLEQHVPSAAKAIKAPVGL